MTSRMDATTRIFLLSKHRRKNKNNDEDDDDDSDVVSAADSVELDDSMTKDRALIILGMSRRMRTKSCDLNRAEVMDRTRTRLEVIRNSRARRKDIRSGLDESAQEKLVREKSTASLHSTSALYITMPPMTVFLKSTLRKLQN